MNPEYDVFFVVSCTAQYLYYGEGLWQRLCRITEICGRCTSRPMLCRLTQKHQLLDALSHTHMSVAAVMYGLYNHCTWGLQAAASSVRDDC